MISIAYVSRSRPTLDDEDIAVILAQSRANNLRLGLTGALLHQPGKFIQILEGADADVTGMYRRIGTDPRHRSIHLVSRETIEERQFGEWTMGFRSLSGEAVTQLGRFDDLFRPRRGARTNPDPAAQLFLDWLGKYWFSEP